VITFCRGEIDPISLKAIVRATCAVRVIHLQFPFAVVWAIAQFVWVCSLNQSTEIAGIADLSTTYVDCFSYTR